jgi:hypothetical protein
MYNDDHPYTKERLIFEKTGKHIGSDFIIE